MPHDRCSKCGAAIVANLRLHLNMNAHGNGKHFCGSDNPGYLAMIQAMREETIGTREMLSDCAQCGLECVRRADSPVLFDVAGFYGLEGDSAIHECAVMATEPEPIQAPPTPLHDQRQPVTPGLRLL